MTRFTHVYSESVYLPAADDKVFAFIDDHRSFSAHMGQSSVMMAGSKMKTTVDGKNGQAVGSHIQMEGNMLGFHLYLDEVITQREPPRLKIWQTVGNPQLIIIADYQMSVRILPRDSGSLLTVTIDYNLPEKNAWLGKLLGGWYAKWCVRQMIQGTSDTFHS